MRLQLDHKLTFIACAALNKAGGGHPKRTPFRLPTRAGNECYQHIPVAICLLQHSAVQLGLVLGGDKEEQSSMGLGSRLLHVCV